jgi:hypothetical protein
VNPAFVAFWETTALPRTDFGPVERFEFATQAAYLAAEMGRLGLGGSGSGSGLATTMERATSFLGIGTGGGAAAGPVGGRRWRRKRAAFYPSEVGAVRRFGHAQAINIATATT